MLYSLNHYYQKARASGVLNLNCAVDVYQHNWVTNEVRRWPEVKTHLDFINKCYSIASEVPFEELMAEYHIAKCCGKAALEKVHLKVVHWMNILNDKDLDYKMGYTPISHIREQLIELWDAIDEEIRNCPPVVAITYSPTFRSVFTSLFG